MVLMFPSLFNTLIYFCFLDLWYTLIMNNNIVFFSNNIKLLGENKIFLTLGIRIGDFEFSLNNIFVEKLNNEKWRIIVPTYNHSSTQKIKPFTLNKALMSELYKWIKINWAQLDYEYFHKSLTPDFKAIAEWDDSASFMQRALIGDYGELK